MARSGEETVKDSNTDRMRTKTRKRKVGGRKERERERETALVLSAGQERAGCHFCQQ